MTGGLHLGVKMLVKNALCWRSLEAPTFFPKVKKGNKEDADAINCTNPFFRREKNNLKMLSQIKMDLIPNNMCDFLLARQRSLHAMDRSLDSTN